MVELHIRKSTIAGRGLFTDVAIRKGKRICFITGKERRHASKNKSEASQISTWYGIGKNMWLDPGKSTFRFLNHSCDPNAAIAGKKTIHALKDIVPGDEITIDYSLTDEDIYWSMECTCGAKTCRKIIRSIQYIPNVVIEKHVPFIPRYFQTIHERSRLSARLEYSDDKQGKN